MSLLVCNLSVIVALISRLCEPLKTRLKSSDSERFVIASILKFGRPTLTGDVGRSTGTATAFAVELETTSVADSANTKAEIKQDPSTSRDQLMV